MSKVFEALQRQQQKPDHARDPLAAQIGAPDHLTSVGENDDFELPTVIGAPVNARANDGVLFPTPTPAEEHTPTAYPINNGRRAAETTAREQRANNRARAITPALRRVPAEQETPAFTPPTERIDPTRLHARLIVLTEPQAAECEQYRTLRTQLFHAAERQPTQIVIVTSAVAGEGKTATALNLALAIAQSKEKRVLIVDGDLRHPTIAPYLGLRARPGLDEVLKGGGEWLENVFCLQEPDLCVLPVNREVANPTELLSSERLPDLFNQLREHFDFIIVDSPPLMPFADARLLANHADGIILVVRAELAPYETVAKAIELLPAERMLGVVLNGAPHLEDNNYYDHYYQQNGPTPRRSFFDRLTRRFRAGSK
jgi:protein-tyrosine kinase